MVRVVCVVLVTILCLYLGTHFGWASTPYLLWLLGYACGVFHCIAIDLSRRQGYEGSTPRQGGRTHAAPGSH